MTPIHRSRTVTIDIDVRQHIISDAYEQFMNIHCVPIYHTDGRIKELSIAYPDQFEAILDVISDGGVLLYPTEESIMDQWEAWRTIRPDNGLCTYLLQASHDWVIRAFDDVDQYRLWCEHLAQGLCVIGDGYHAQIKNKNNHIPVLVDDEYADRLPRSNSYEDILTYNPWWCFLLTLQLSYPRLHDLIRQLDAVQPAPPRKTPEPPQS